VIATVVQVAGLACLTAAAWLVEPAFGVAVLGAGLLLVGIGLERAGPSR
jgi:hypothetical protein